MFVKSFDFSYKTPDGGWEIKNCELGSINLISGKNASGKTRLLRALEISASFLSIGKIKIHENLIISWSIHMEDNEKDFYYYLECQSNQVNKEELKIDNKILLSRDESGKGEIHFKELDKELSFEIEMDRIVATYRRDKKQHPFLEPLLKWSKLLFVYNFGGLLGKEEAVEIQELEPKKITISNIDTGDIDTLNKDEDAVVPKFDIGTKKFKEKFKKRILEDFNGIGYQLDDIFIGPVQFGGSVICIKENGLSESISQIQMSQGMFRALSLIIQLTYLEFGLDSHYTILIDDIGEGLDFERSTNLIKLLVQKAELLKDRVQLVMTTNDRFVMNSVPLEYWTILDRSDGSINIYSERTSSEIFKKFQYVGLNNFDFFSGQYYKQNQLL